MGSSCGRHKQAHNGVVQTLLQPRSDEAVNTSAGSVRRKTSKTRGAVINTRKIPASPRRSLSLCKEEREKTHWEAERIALALQKHPVLSDLDTEARGEVVRCMELYTIEAGEVVVEEGEPATRFFVIGHGSLEVLQRGRRVNILRAGESFGEKALLHNTVRSATVRTLDRCSLWGLDRPAFQRAFETVSSHNYQENKAFIDSVPLLSLLSLEQKENLLAVLVTQQYLPNQKIVVEGEKGDLLFIVKQGLVACSVSGEEIRRMGPGEYFGEQALLHETVRSATVTAIDSVRLLSIAREQAIEVLGNSLERVIYRNSQRMSLEESPLFAPLSDQTKEALIEAMEVVCYEDGEVVLPRRTTLKSRAYMVLKGELRAREGVWTAGRLTIVGATQMMSEQEEPVQWDVLAVGETHIAEFTKETFERIVGGSVSEVVHQILALGVLRQVSIFRSFSHERLLKLYSVILTQALKIAQFDTGAEIVTQGESSRSLFIVKSGTVTVTKNGVVLRTIGSHGFFGERSILLKEKRTASVVADCPVECWELLQQDFLEVIDESISATLAKRMELQDDSVTLDQLVLVKELGKGTSGSVYLVVHREKHSLYAIKTVTRRTVTRLSCGPNLANERELLLQLDHPFIMKMVKTFKDAGRVYFLLEFVQGQDLFDAIRVLGLLKDTQCAFYVASLLCILEHLHQAGIVYRDLKPENVMLDAEGYPKLIDFGTAKKIEGRTFTIVGTPHYMAPEVVIGRGYGNLVDVWSLGIMLYEFVCGTVPFGENQDDPMQVYEEVLKQPLRFNTVMPKSSSLRAFLESLLHKNPAFRCSVSRLKQHQWLSAFDWEKLYLKQLNPPLMPKIRDLSGEIGAVLSTGKSMCQVLEEADLAALEESPSQLPETDGWDKDF